MSGYDIEHRIDTLVAEYGCVPPPWALYPEEHPYSMFWRMGGGESHIIAWSQWWERQNLPEAARIAYFEQWLPPPCWQAWAVDAIWEPDGEADEIDYGPWFARLYVIGFVDVAAYEADLEHPRWLES